METTAISPSSHLSVDPTRLVQAIADNMFSAHRGAFRLHDDTCVIFGNDAYGSDPRTKTEVEKVREYLKERDIPELVFQADPREGEEEYTWIMIVDTDDACAMFDLVWQAWRDVHGDIDGYRSAFEVVQRQIAADVCDDAEN